MSTVTPELIDDLEALLKPYARRPEDRIWLPISLFTMQDRSVAVAVRPEGRKVLVTDEGETLAVMRDLGLEVEPESATARDIGIIAKRRGFLFDGYSFSRKVTPDEIPTAALHLSEVEIAVSALLHVRYMAPSVALFANQARATLEQSLKPRAAQLVKFKGDYAVKYKDGDFFCVAETKRPIGVKLVTNSENMRDAVIVGLMYDKEPIELAALRKPRIRLVGRRVVQFASMYANHTFERAEKLASYLNERVAS